MKKMKIETNYGHYMIVEVNKEIVEIYLCTAVEEGTDTSALLEQAKKQLIEYFTRKRKTFTFPINPQGTPFQKEVWQKMMEIPYGKVISYGNLAAAVNRPKASRAVGSCCNRNPIGIVIPCHRVIAANSKIGGFAHEVGLKIRLLELEGSEI